MPTLGASPWQYGGTSSCSCGGYGGSWNLSHILVWYFTNLAAGCIRRVYVNGGLPASTINIHRSLGWWRTRLFQGASDLEWAQHTADDCWPHTHKDAAPFLSIAQFTFWLVSTWDPSAQKAAGCAPHIWSPLRQIHFCVLIQIQLKAMNYKDKFQILLELEDLPTPILFYYRKQFLVKRYCTS